MFLDIIALVSIIDILSFSIHLECKLKFDANSRLAVLFWVPANQ